MPPPPPPTLTCVVPPSTAELTVPLDEVTSLSDLRDALFSLTDILPDTLHITLPSGATLAPDAPDAPLAALPLQPGDRVSAAAAPPPPVSAAAVAAALAEVAGAGGAQPPRPPASAGSDEGRAYVRRVRGYQEAVAEYGDARLQERARAVAPLKKLRAEAAAALGAAKEEEEEGEGKAGGEGKGCRDAALARALLAWFKNDFFTWVDALPCWSCGGEGRVVGHVEPTPAERKYRASVVELHACVKCGSSVRFGRFNDPTKLLETRKGRCGEWAQAFTLLAIAAGLEARVCHDSTDHVWTEIWSHKERRWLHADSCENSLDEPLLYETGWGKKLAYVVAVGAGSVCDVTRRYTADYDAVLTRRTIADEKWLAAELARLNASAVSAVPVHDRAAVIARNDADHASLWCAEPGATATFASNLPGRQSGSESWVRERGEGGEQ